jgi:hypothetical protein
MIFLLMSDACNALKFLKKLSTNTDKRGRAPRTAAER